MNKTSKVILAVVVVVAIAAALIVMMAGSKDNKSNNTSNSTTNSSATQPQASTNQEGVAATVTYTSSGFSPSSVTVKSGDKIKFVNNSDSAIQPSSDPHPVHTDNPELNVGQIQPGESSTITVANKGTWGMHNHFNSSQKVTVVIN